jgi:hypothetical protein
MNLTIKIAFIMLGVVLIWAIGVFCLTVGLDLVLVGK